MRMIAKIVAAGAAVVGWLSPAHGQDKASVGASQPEQGSSAWHTEQQLYLLSLTPEEGWHFATGGVRWRWLEYRASQAKPSVADVVTVHYEGRLLDGTVFDSSYARGAPATFPLNRLVRGWQIAIPEMGVGDTIEIAIPADLAYGPVGRGPIPGNATLVFKVELIAIED
jgi:FKBP-type peptidyl-prolyl cis-trans isomerase FkpA